MSRLQTKDTSIVIADEGLNSVLEIKSENKTLVLMVFPEEPEVLHVNEHLDSDPEGTLTATTLASSDLEAHLNFTLPETFNSKSADLIRLFMVFEVYPHLGMEVEYLEPNQA